MLSFPCSTASATQKNLISIDQDCLRFTVLFAMPTAVELSQWIGVGGWGWPISSSVSQKFIACLQFRNNAPSSASAADATTNLSIAHNVLNAPLIWWAWLDWISVPYRSVHMLCCGRLLWTGKTCLSEFLTSCPTCGIALSLLSASQGNWEVILFFAFYNWWLSIVRSQ